MLAYTYRGSLTTVVGVTSFSSHMFDFSTWDDPVVIFYSFSVHPSAASNLGTSHTPAFKLLCHSPKEPPFGGVSDLP